MKLLPLSGRKLSVMPAEMLEFCAAGESTATIFDFLFFQQLLKRIHVLLSEDDPRDMRAMAEKAERLITLHPSHTAGS